MRSNLILLTPVAVPIFVWLLWRQETPHRTILLRVAFLFLGLALGLAPLVVRNHAISGQFSIAPNNGGIVLHQLYNPENPQSRGGVPAFVGHYSTPGDIWNSYHKEAERRTGHAMVPHEVDTYWRDNARAWLLEHPGQALANAWRKFREFTAWPEVPNTRSWDDERRASPLLAWFPSPFGWLFALGVPGLVLSFRHDARTLLVLTPVAVGVLTIMMFFAEDRFRFNIIGPFALGVGIWTTAAWRTAISGRWRKVAAMAAISAVLGGWSLWQAHALIPTYPSDWQRMAWGYLKSGQRGKAETIIAETEHELGAAPGLYALKGYIALIDKRPNTAVPLLELAISQRDDLDTTWHNYSRALEDTGNYESALAAQLRAFNLAPTPEHAFRIAELLERNNRINEAMEMYQNISNDPAAGSWGEKAGARMKTMEPDFVGP